MSGQEKDPASESIVSEFAEIIASHAGDAPVLVGGHAVNLWSEYHLAKGVTELAAYMPFTSKDLDLFGPPALLDRILETHKGTLTRSEPRSPVLGRIDLERKVGMPLRIEVLHMVKGLDEKDLARTMELRMGSLVARVLLPHLILKAKIENSRSIQQEGRNDVKHVRMMILCVRAFIAEFAEFVAQGRLGERALVNLLEECLEITTNSGALDAKALWGFDFDGIWPFPVLKTLGHGKVSRWLDHRFPA